MGRACVSTRPYFKIAQILIVVVVVVVVGVL
jgi:hypothetical protein